jgi:hypothetical protein
MEEDAVKSSDFYIISNYEESYYNCLNYVFFFEINTKDVVSSCIFLNFEYADIKEHINSSQLLYIFRYLMRNCGFGIRKGSKVILLSSFKSLKPILGETSLEGYYL